MMNIYPNETKTRNSMQPKRRMKTSQPYTPSIILILLTYIYETTVMHVYINLFSLPAYFFSFFTSILFIYFLWCASCVDSQDFFFNFLFSPSLSLSQAASHPLFLFVILRVTLFKLWVCFSMLMQWYTFHLLFF